MKTKPWVDTPILLAFVAMFATACATPKVTAAPPPVIEEPEACPMVEDPHGYCMCVVVCGNGPPTMIDMPEAACRNPPPDCVTLPLYCDENDLNKIKAQASPSPQDPSDYRSSAPEQRVYEL